MNVVTPALLFILFIPTVFLGGCGDNRPAIGAVTVQEATEPCLACHSTATSPVTGLVIYEEWKLSAHNATNGAGCDHCHETEPGHPNSCKICHGVHPPAGPIHDVTFNPDTSRKCSKCHTARSLSPGHFANVTTLNLPTYPASRVSSRYVGNCRKCHNPHDPSSQIAVNRQWSASGHGSVTAAAWTAHDFKVRGTAGATAARTAGESCVRCHTTTGYINYVDSGFTDVSGWGRENLVNLPAFSGDSNYFNSVDKTKEVLACNGCHDDGRGNTYLWSRIRPVSSVTAYYNYSSRPTGKLLVSVPFPDLKTSNGCMPCHTGMESGRTIKAMEAVEAASGAFAIFSSAGAGMPFLDAHAMSAGATIFKTSGYEYPGRDYTNRAHYRHDEIGLGKYPADTTGGPCTGCHMVSTAKHSLQVVSTVSDSLPLTGNRRISGISAAATCNNVWCHGFSPQDLRTPSFLQHEKEGYNAALAALAKALKMRAFIYQGGTVNFSTTNWQTDRGNQIGGYGSGTGGRTMGAAFNFNLLRRDPGGYVHNSIYAKRLIYDSIDWITNGLSGGTQVDTAINSLPDDPILLVGADGSRINFDQTVKAAAIAYLMGTDTNPSGIGNGRP